MKLVGLATIALVLTAAGAAEAQTIISRQVKAEPVETVVTRQPNGTITTSRRPVHMASLTTPSSRAAVQPAVARSASVVRKAPAQKIIYRTVVRREIVQAPQPQAVVVREPVTRWMPSILPPFSYPVTTYEDRVVYTTPAYAAATYATPTYIAPTYRTVAVQPVADEDDMPVLRAAYTPSPVESYLLRY
jgi:hypothetical protein